MPTNLVPKRLYLTNGVGVHAEKLQSFELALRDAGIATLNLVLVSSIYPPGCRIISRNSGLAKLVPGQITYCVMAEARTNEPNRLVSAGIGLAIPAKGDQFGAPPRPRRRHREQDQRPGGDRERRGRRRSRDEASSIPGEGSPVGTIRLDGSPRPRALVVPDQGSKLPERTSGPLRGCHSRGSVIWQGQARHPRVQEEEPLSR